MEEFTMIRLENKEYVAYCDGECGASVNTGQRSFQQATNYLSRVEEWDSVQQRGAWRNYCPGCAQGGVPDPDIDQIGVHFARRSIDDDD
jgi:hypothetical protein